MKELIELTKNQLIEGKYKYPKTFITLIPSEHCLKRLEERGKELDFLPSVVRITENNICSGKVGGKTLVSVVIKIEYSCSKYLFLCFCPINGVLKTVWFENRTSKQNSKKSSKRTV